MKLLRRHQSRARDGRLAVAVKISATCDIHPLAQVSLSHAHADRSFARDRFPHVRTWVMMIQTSWWEVSVAAKSSRSLTPRSRTLELSATDKSFTVRCEERDTQPACPSTSWHVRKAYESRTLFACFSVPSSLERPRLRLMFVGALWVAAQ